MANLKFKIKATSLNSTKLSVKARNFELIVDEPQNLGGTNEGANPVEYILAGYAGCLNVMSHVCAKELGIDLKGVEIIIEGTLNPARLFGTSFEERAGYKEIRASIIPDCNADKEIMKEWLAAIVDRCPVGDNLKNKTDVIVTFK